MPRELRWVRLRVPCYDMDEQGEMVPRGVIPEVIGDTPTLEELQAEINRIQPKG